MMTYYESINRNGSLRQHPGSAASAGALGGFIAISVDAHGSGLSNRVFKNKHKAVSQGVRRFGKRSICINM
jgi:hypothetical protein